MRLLPLLLVAFALTGCGQFREFKRLEAQRNAQRQAAIHAYCREHVYECEQLAIQREQQAAVRRAAITRALVGDGSQQAYQPPRPPRQVDTTCNSYGNTARCSTTYY